MFSRSSGSDQSRPSGEPLTSPQEPALPPPLPAHYVLVNEWIETATRGLCVEARERIAAEVRRHVCEAVAEFEAPGQSPEEALTAAIRQLGDAKSARRGFKRTNLTKREARIVSSPRVSPDLEFVSTLCFRSLEFAGAAFLLFGFGLVVYEIHRSGSWLDMWHVTRIVLGGFVVYAQAATLMHSLRGKWRWSLAFRSVASFGLVIMLFEPGYMFDPVVGFYICCIYGVLAIPQMAFAMFCARLWWKMGYVVGGPRQEL
ncbi:MAG: permease prefix domain 1-containing protein [Candidatus Hydrogenedentes bacterium]|nr:permease prefix domain 1-containing protein [Candidatus Hydrogenedentota bacterium]